MNVYDIMTSRHVSSLDIEQVELDTLRKMYETLKNGGDTYGNTDDVAVLALAIGSQNLSSGRDFQD